ncbi:MAG: hypothetical protein M1421_04795 [Candidatus Eremiobacteraeota bacterium]|jgi:hypothetical protein|nr:hypothetical protein [Candidatus Eremiobacteraeota bacterium]MCL5054722.1 hypothetical protein [Bacillota bacterium]
MLLEKKRGRVKKGISLIPAQEEQVERLAKELKISFSRVVQEALTLFTKQIEAAREEDLYCQYYADPKNVARHTRLTNDLKIISKRALKNE